MNLLTIPARNIMRKPIKVLLLLGAFSLGIMSIVTLFQVSLVVGESMEKKLSSYGANIVVSPEAEKLSISYGGFHMGDMLLDVQELSETETVAAINRIELNDRISTVAPKLVSMTKVKQIAVAVIGVDWEAERRIKSYWATEGDFPSDEDQLLLGRRAAEKLDVTLGEVLSVRGRDFTVSGILYETGSDDDSVIFIGIKSLQVLLNKPDATSYVEVAALCAGCPIEDIVNQIHSQLPNASVRALQNVVNQRMASIRFVQRLALSVSLVILITAAAMVGLSMLSAVNERRKDIGILRSLGFSKMSIFIVFCVESAAIGAAAGLIGYLSGYAFSFKALDLLAMTEGMVPTFSGLHLLTAIALFASITIVASLYPAWKGSAMEPSSAVITL